MPLVASPINTVTLPDAARARAGIPKDAMFYCYCYPLLSTTDAVASEGEAEVQGSGNEEGGRSHGSDATTGAYGRDEMGRHAARTRRRAEQLKGMEEKLDMLDPFVCLLKTGEFDGICCCGC